MVTSSVTPFNQVEIDRLQRMSEQRHPDVIPLCMQAIAEVRDRLTQEAESLQFEDDSFSQETPRVIGRSALVLGGVELASYGANKLLHSDLDTSTLLVVGTVMIGVRMAYRAITTAGLRGLRSNLSNKIDWVNRLYFKTERNALNVSINVLQAGLPEQT